VQIIYGLFKANPCAFYACCHSYMVHCHFMKQILSMILLLLLIQPLYAEHWHYTRADFTFENDADIREDSGYTEGAQFSMLMHRKNGAESWLQIPLMQDYVREHFITFAMGQQMFTPEDLDAIDPITGDRPYAGWLYLQSALHQSSEHHLDSLSLKLGMVGQHAYMEHVQKFIHWMIGSPEPKGWGNQIGSRLGAQLDYEHKWRFVPDDLWGMESDLIPFVGGELGTVAVKANAGAMWRVGYNIPQDFGSSPIDEYGANGVPTTAVLHYRYHSKWHYYVNFGAGGSVVLYDVFLDAELVDGTTLVEKNYLKAFGSYGATLGYGALEVTYIRTHYTSEYKSQNLLTNYGSLLFVYKF